MLIQLQLSKDEYHVRSLHRACPTAPNAALPEDMDPRSVYVVGIILLRRLGAPLVLNHSGTASIIPRSQCTSIALSSFDSLEAAFRYVTGAKGHIETPGMGIRDILLPGF
jgi:hypothetical protein